MKDTLKIKCRDGKTRLWINGSELTEVAEFTLSQVGAQAPILKVRQTFFIGAIHCVRRAQEK